MSHIDERIIQEERRLDYLRKQQAQELKREAIKEKQMAERKRRQAERLAQG